MTPDDSKGNDRIAGKSDTNGDLADVGPVETALADTTVVEEEAETARFWGGVRRRTLILTGWALLAVGVVATIAPTPFGIVLVGVALTILLTHSPWTKLRFRRYMRRYPETLSPLLRIPSIKEAIKIRKRRRKARLKAKALAREADQGVRE